MRWATKQTLTLSLYLSLDMPRGPHHFITDSQKRGDPQKLTHPIEDAAASRPSKITHPGAEWVSEWVSGGCRHRSSAFPHRPLSSLSPSRSENLPHFRKGCSCATWGVREECKCHSWGSSLPSRLTSTCVREYMHNTCILTHALSLIKGWEVYERQDGWRCFQLEKHFILT